MKFYKTLKPWALVAVWVVAGFFIVSQKAISEQITTYNYDTGTFTTSNIQRSNGRVNIQRYDYGTDSFSTYSGDANSGTGYDYGTGSFTTTTGDPYGAGQDDNR